MASRSLFALLVVAAAMCASVASALRSRAATDPNMEVKFDFTPFLIQYRSGRVQRLMGTTVVAPSLDVRTGVVSKDVVVDRSTGLAVRLYRPKHRGGRLPVLIYFHGGAFVVESAFDPVYHNYLNALAAKAGAIAVSVNYRLAPEHPLPAAYDDAWTVLRWVAADMQRGADSWLARRGDASRLFVAGDSAGGNIAHNLAMRAGQHGGGATIRGVALLDPYFLGKYVDPTAQRAWGFICAGRYGMEHPYVNPMALPAASWRRLATSRVLMTVSDLDRLGPWQRAYVDALRGSGWPGEARLYVTPGEGHCYFLNNLESPKAAMHMATLAAYRKNIAVSSTSVLSFTVGCDDCLSVWLISPPRFTKHNKQKTINSVQDLVITLLIPAMNPDTEVDFDFSPLLIRYKSGRVHRLMGTARVDAGTDAVTGVTSKDVVIDAQSGGLAARLYLPGGVPRCEKLPVVVYFHGGGFVVHSAFSRVHSRFLNALVAAAGVVAVSVDYRLAPEHPLPAAYDDAWAALRWTVASCSASGGPEPWLAEHGDAARIFVAGDSAGANIAHNVTMRAGKDGLPGGARIEGMVLLHPFFRGGELVPSERADPELPRRAERSWGFMCAGRYGIDHPFINPLSTPAEEWAALGCRRALVTVGELDTMRDRARMYVEALRGSAWEGEEAALYETGGEGHVYFLEEAAAAAGGDKAEAELDAVVSFIKRSSAAT
uniref:Alpha/beta hydrolase fold-3 domain-containing protein n=1 Tax=Oryza glumipatula TaxID=40148 RepID=A0A0E0AWJ4_9ORYZ